MSEELATVKAEDLALVDYNLLNEKHLALLLRPTPKKFVKTRPAKGGGTWNFVSGTYVRKVLNLMFGWDWDFEVLSEQVLFNEVVVKARLTVRVNGKAISKTQFGNKEIIFKKSDEKIPLSIGNDMKAAATDALKKCAQDLGIAQDVYAPSEFLAVKIEESEEVTLGMLIDRFEAVKTTISNEEIEHATRIIQNKETENYSKLWKLLK